MMPRVVTSALAVAAAFGFVAMPSESAPGSFANQPFQTWDTDGAVSSIVATPSAVYVGGNFTQIGRRTGSSAALSPAGQVESGWPESDGTVSAVVSDGSGGWFIGGTFKRVGGLARSGLAHITREKNVDARWAPAISPAGSGYVNVLAGGARRSTPAAGLPRSTGPLATVLRRSMSRLGRARMEPTHSTRTRRWTRSPSAQTDGRSSLPAF